MSLMTVLHTIAGLFFIFLGIFAFMQNRKSKINLVFLFLSIACSIWSLGTGFQWIATTKDQAFLWNKIASIGFITAPGLILIFTVLISKKRTEPISVITYILTFLPAIILLITYFFFDTFCVYDFEKTDLGWKEMSSGDLSMNLVFLLYFMICVIVSIVILAGKYKATQSADIKKQSMIMMITLGVCLLLTGLNESFIPDVLNFKTFPKISSIIFMIWGIGMLYIIIKYRLCSLEDSIAKNKIETKPDNKLSV
jgi:hypothetical protein